MASVEAVAASEAALEAAVDLSMTWRRCPDGSAAAAAGSTLAGMVALVSSHLLYELPGIPKRSPLGTVPDLGENSSLVFAVFRTDRQTDRRTDRQTDGLKVREVQTTSSSS